MQYAQRHATGGESPHMALSHSQGHKAWSTLAIIVTARNGDKLQSSVTNGNYSHCQRGQGLMQSNAATKIRSEQAGVLWWMGRDRGHVTNMHGTACHWLQWQVTSNEQTNRVSITDSLPESVQDGNAYWMLQSRIWIRTHNSEFENSAFI